MKIVFCSHGFPPTHFGGIELFGLQLIHRLQRLGVEVRVICDYSAVSAHPVSDYEGIRIHRYPLRAALLSKDASRIKAMQTELQDFFREFGPDLIHLNTLEAAAAFFFLRLKEQNHCKLVLTLHDPPGERFSKMALQQNLAAVADATVSVTQSVQREFLEHFPNRSRRQYVIWNALEQPEKALHPFPEGPLRLFSAGRIVPEKGYDLVLEALANMEDTSVSWTLAGEGNAEESIRQQCARLGLQTRVIFLGRILWQDVYEQIDKCHAVVMPSRVSETFGLVALQAAQRARPVIASRIGGLQEVVEEDKTGMFFKPGDAGELARLLTERSNLARLAEMGMNAHERAKRLFNIEAMATRYHEIFQEVLSGNSDPA